MTYKLLTKCQGCDKYVGMYSASMVKCNRAKYCIVLSDVAPSFWNKGIKNGVMVVACNDHS